MLVGGNSVRCNRMLDQSYSGRRDILIHPKEVVWVAPALHLGGAIVVWT